MMPRNMSVYWLAASAVAVWFLFIHSPPFIIRRRVYQDFPLATHMTGAYMIYLACMFNTLFTPSSLHGKARPWHIWIGRIGMISGLVSFAFGLYCAWWPNRPVRPPLGFSIGISIGGIMQVYTQRAAYQAIRHFSYLKIKIQELEKSGKNGSEVEMLKKEKGKALHTHIYQMVALFVAACGIPAGMRIAETLPLPKGYETIGMVAIIALFQMLVGPFGDTYVCKKQKGQ